MDVCCMNLLCVIIDLGVFFWGFIGLRFGGGCG